VHSGEGASSGFQRQAKTRDKEKKVWKRYEERKGGGPGGRRYGGGGRLRGTTIRVSKKKKKTLVEKTLYESVGAEAKGPKKGGSLVKGRGVGEEKRTSQWKET